jgi:hypothetical protein
MWDRCGIAGRRWGGWSQWAAVGLFALVAMPVWAANARATPKSDNSNNNGDHPWLFVSPQHSPQAYFSNLQDGALVPSPVAVRFGLSLRGIVPAGHKVGLAGHHHLLVNQGLPLDFTQPLPFTSQYIHFGKGQMETALNLQPGRYRLQLVLADQGHIPYFVYSKAIHITVAPQHTGQTKAQALGPPRVEIIGLAAGDTLQPPFRLAFHASGFNIAPAAAQLLDTHYFRLVLEREGAKPEVLNFKSGQTETWLNPPKGAYTARLALVRNATRPEAIAVRAQPVAFSVGP